MDVIVLMEEKMLRDKRKGCPGERGITKVNEMETRKAIIEKKKQLNLAILVHFVRDNEITRLEWGYAWWSGYSNPF